MSKITLTIILFLILGIFPNFFKYPVTDVLGITGGNVTIHCAPEAAPKPTLTWTFNEIDLGQPPFASIGPSGNFEVQTIFISRFYCLIFPISKTFLPKSFLNMMQFSVCSVLLAVVYYPKATVSLF